MRTALKNKHFNNFLTKNKKKTNQSDMWNNKHLANDVNKHTVHNKHCMQEMSLLK